MNVQYRDKITGEVEVFDMDEIDHDELVARGYERVGLDVGNTEDE